MLKRIVSYMKNSFKEDYKFIIAMLFIFIILNIPLNYYIIVGGGISDAEERIKVDNKYKTNGSFNISYVTQLNANVLTYALSYVIPYWEKENADVYKYDETEDMDNIEFRSELDLKTANGNATYWAYKLAGKTATQTSKKLYVIATYPKEFKTTLKVKDEIISMDGNQYDNTKQYIEYIQTKNANDEVIIKVIRDKKEKEIKSKIYEKNGTKLLGITLQYVKEYKTNPKLKIKFKRNESGPSGGLITTLEIYNQLTKKDLTKGRIIAGTGTIEEDGSIGEIGGIEHKVLGASRAKASIFLSPGGQNYKDAKKYIKEKNLKIKLIKVETISEAIEKLEGSV